MQIKIYANYGLLAREKQTIFTALRHAEGDCWDEYIVEIPDEYIGYSACDPEQTEPMFALPNESFLRRLDDVLIADKDDKPCLHWLDDDGWHTIKLKILQEV